jgi:hypothetical protein
VRCASKTILHDRNTLKQHGKLTQVGEELSNESYEIGVATRRLRERVLDPALRAAPEQFRIQVSDVELSFFVVNDMSAEDGIKYLDGQLRILTEHYVAIGDLIGAALRIELGWLPEEGKAG